MKGLIAAIFLSFCFAINAQDNDILDRQISISFENQDLKSCFRQISTIEPGITFSYSDEIIPSDYYVSEAYSNKKISYIISEILFGAGLTFSVIDEFVIISPKEVKDHRIFGYIRDKNSNELLYGAAIYIPSQQIGTIANEFGYYNFTLSGSKHSLICSYLGYESDTIHINIDSDELINFQLQALENRLSPIVITEQKTSIGLPGQSIKTTKIPEHAPTLAGEPDIIKSLAFLPGIENSYEGSSSFHIRGGEVDQNLLLLDDAPIYNPNHLLGFFSTFNVDAIKEFKLYKHFIPAQYGGRVSSVLDIRMKDGDMLNPKFKSSIGLYSGSIAAEGPIVKGKSSFFISSRRTLLDLYLKTISFNRFKDSDFYFYDINAKTQFSLNQNNNIYLSLYSGRDKFFLDATEDQTFDNFQWGNQSGSIRWTNISKQNRFVNTTFVLSDYQFFNDQLNNFEFRTTRTRTSLANLKQDLSWYLRNDHKLRIGWNSAFMIFNPGSVQEEDGYNQWIDQRQGFENAIYISDEFISNKKFSIILGLRYSNYIPISNGQAYNLYNEGGILIDSIKKQKGKAIDYFHGLEPRIFFSYELNNKHNFSLSFQHLKQYQQLISSVDGVNPQQFWIPSSPNIDPISVWQGSMGWNYKPSSQIWSLNLESYYKYYQSINSAADPRTLFLNNELEAYIFVGEGRSYGLEASIQYAKNRFQSLVTYTLSYSDRLYDKLNYGLTFPSDFLKRNSFFISAQYALTDNLKMAANWVFKSGNLLTPPAGIFIIDGQLHTLLGLKNDYITRPYHRMDVSLNYDFENRTGRLKQSLNLGIYNLYGRKNPVYSYFEIDQTNAEIASLKHISYYRLVPTLRYYISF